MGGWRGFRGGGVTKVDTSQAIDSFATTTAAVSKTKTSERGVSKRKGEKCKRKSTRSFKSYEVQIWVRDVVFTRHLRGGGSSLGEKEKRERPLCLVIQQVY